MYNPAASPRSPKPWQAAATMQRQSQAPEFDAMAWLQGKQGDFADGGLRSSAQSFAQRQYNPVKQPLLQKTLDALARLDDAQLLEDFALPQKKKGGYLDESPNAHLPFVPDVYEPLGRQKNQSMAAELTLPQRTSSWADHIETIVHEDLLADADGQTSESQATRAVPDDPSHDFTDSLSEADSDSNTVEPKTVQLEEEALARRDAEQHAAGFAQGMAQGRTEGQAQGLDQGRAEGRAEGHAQGHAEGLLKGQREGRQEGFDKGLALGRSEGLQEGYAAGCEAGRAAGYEVGRAEGAAQGLAQGIAQGEATANATLAEEMAAQRQLFVQAAQELQTLLGDGQQFFEPFKRLALHLAEQLVLGELSASPQAIERLVQRCLDELDHPNHGAVVIELNPEDKARMQKHGGELLRGMRLEGVPELKPGSVRVLANDTMVQDLVENRLSTLAQTLKIDEKAWRDQSVMLGAAASPTPATTADPVQVPEEHVESDDAHS